jgi:hypothetical protein
MIDEQREKLAVERRIAELVGCEIVRRRPRAAIVRVDGKLILLDGGRLARDPKHTGFALVGGDLSLNAELC